MRAGVGCRARIVALCVLAAAPAASAQDFGGCARPRPWGDVFLHPDAPLAEVGACLKEKAWDVRRLKIPLQDAAAGVVAQCEVEVIDFAGPQGSDARFQAEREVNAADREIVRKATAMVIHYRSCLGS